MNRHGNGFFDGREALSMPAVLPATAHPVGVDEGPMVILAGAATAARRRVVPLVLWVLLCLGAAAWYLHVTPPSYTATATVILDPKRPAAAMGEAAAAMLPPTLDAAVAESQIQVIRSERLLSSVFDALGLADAPSLRPGPPGLVARAVNAVAGLFRTPGTVGDDKAERAAAAYDSFVGRVGARRVGQSYVIEVSYTSGDRAEARRLANAVVSGYLGQQVSFKLAAAQNGAEYLQGRVKALGDEVKAAGAGMLAGTVPAMLLPDADARVIGAALEPLGRSAPKSGLVVGFAAAFGLLSGLFAVAVLNGLDRRVRSTDQLERATGLPCLGSIPDTRRRKGFAKRPFGEMARLACREPDSRFAAAMRDTRTSILLAFDGKPGLALGVTSWAGGAGRSVVAANLAGVVALSGSPVVLVDADIHSMEGGLTALGSPVQVSLTESLLDPTGATLPEAVALDPELHLVPARSAYATGGIGGAGRARGMDVYLGAPGLPRLVEGWRGRGDVVVDLPALASGGDARAAAARLDGVVDRGRRRPDHHRRRRARHQRAVARRGQRGRHCPQQDRRLSASRSDGVRPAASGPHAPHGRRRGVDLLVAVRHGGHGELSRREGGRGAPAGELARLGRQPAQGRRGLRDAADRHEDARPPAVDHLGHAAGLRGHHGAAGGPRLGHHEPEGLGLRHVEEDRGAAQQRPGVQRAPGEDHPAAEAEPAHLGAQLVLVGALAHHGEPPFGRRGGHGREGRDGVADALAPVQARQRHGVGLRHRGDAVRPERLAHRAERAVVHRGQAVRPVAAAEQQAPLGVRHGRDAVAEAHQAGMPVEGVVHRGDQRAAPHPRGHIAQRRSRHHVGVDDLRPMAAQDAQQRREPRRRAAAGLGHRGMAHPVPFEQLHVGAAAARIDDVMPAGSLFAGQVDGDVHMAVAALAVFEQVHDTHSKHPLGSTLERLRSRRTARGMIDAHACRFAQLSYVFTAMPLTAERLSLCSTGLQLRGGSGRTEGSVDRHA